MRGIANLEAIKDNVLAPKAVDGVLPCRILVKLTVGAIDLGYTVDVQAAANIRTCLLYTSEPTRPY